MASRGGLVVIFGPCYDFDTGCAAYLCGCGGNTPGHTPESVCLVVNDLRRGMDPWFVLTGDTLFTGSVGRPDLPGEAQAHVAVVCDSLHAKPLTLPPDLEVYPAHFAGSACGAGLSGKPSSTVAFVETVARPLGRPPRMREGVRINRGEAASG